MIPLTWGAESSQMLRDQKWSWRVSGAGGGVNGTLFCGCRLWVWADEKVLKVDGGDGYTAVWLCLVPHPTLKIGYDGTV